MKIRVIDVHDFIEKMDNYRAKDLLHLIVDRDDKIRQQVLDCLEEATKKYYGVGDD